MKISILTPHGHLITLSAEDNRRVVAGAHESAYDKPLIERDDIENALTALIRSSVIRVEEKGQIHNL